MKKLLLVALVFIVVQKWGAITAYFNPPPDFSQLHSEPVVMYATEWCGYCAQAREFLARHNVPYFEYDIEASEEGLRQYKAIGRRGVPVMLVNGEVVQGYRPDKMAELLGL